MIFIPYYTKNLVLESIDIAEVLKGSPPNTPECYAVFVVHHRQQRHSMSYFNTLLQNLYREDHFYADKQFNHWTIKRDEEDQSKKEFENFSE